MESAACRAVAVVPQEEMVWEGLYAICSRAAGVYSLVGFHAVHGTLPRIARSDADDASCDGRKREDCLKKTDLWNADPDTYVYVIFRKVGDELPKFVEDETAIHGLTIDNKSNGATYNLSGQQVGKDFKGVVIKDGKKIVNK